jgi:hypothetical protein
MRMTYLAMCLKINRTDSINNAFAIYLILEHFLRKSRLNESPLTSILDLRSVTGVVEEQRAARCVTSKPLHGS